MDHEVLNMLSASDRLSASRSYGRIIEPSTITYALGVGLPFLIAIAVLAAIWGT